ncbi:hypothetical protein HBH69_042150 [Parastagonospora nodorum]|nr:hypothetical protein HBI04_221950 [Parastagonospora nodorum]KAH4267272.1 hypothetical protein HBI03_069060 [Parastagonospora nodorum]KAH5160546.1 hypothetical protein HBH69_042150 [Parastagonospora nodorum]KAH5431468.1 hypothetical protein HBI32_060920 [Parastagonospora nodorum]KAH6050714.1 hypothetical protein HBI54_044340 [Parastagonospora nodorum]
MFLARPSSVLSLHCHKLYLHLALSNMVPAQGVLINLAPRLHSYQQSKLPSLHLHLNRRLHYPSTHLE